MEVVPEDKGLARERTALAWVRTGLAFAAAGAALLRFLRGAERPTLALAATLVVLGVVAWLWGWTGPGRPAVDTPLGRIVVRVLAIGTAAVAVAEIVLHAMRPVV